MYGSFGDDLESDYGRLGMIDKRFNCLKRMHLFSQVQ